MMIILTAKEADQVRGETVPGHAIEPRELLDGTYAVTTAVCSDPHHAAKHAFLQSLPIKAVAADDYVTEEE